MLNHVDCGDLAQSLPAIDCLGSDQGHEALHHPEYRQDKIYVHCTYTYIYDIERVIN